MDMRKINIISGIIILALSAIFWMDAAKIRPPAHIYPKTIIAIIAFLGLALLIQAVFFPKSLSQTKPFTGLNYNRVLVAILTTLMYYFGIKTIGFYVSSFFFIIVLTWLLGEREVGIKVFARLGTLSIVVMGLIFLGFNVFLKVPTPTGILF
ncbi:MAG: tripartite tricarboxylate transporter TctB family protein [Peptococcales bacterium]|jgi:hypothetical protein